MSSELPGLDIAGRVRAKDIQMAAMADVRHRVLMITGAVDVIDHGVAMTLHLPEPGRWQVIKAETNLTDRTWTAMQIVTDADTRFVEEADSTVLSRQFARSFLAPDMRRLTLHHGEVRPGESVLMSFVLDCATDEPRYAHSHYIPEAHGSGDPTSDLEGVIADGMPQRPMLEMSVPVTVVR